MPFGPRRGYSDHLRPCQVRGLQAATSYAEEIGRPLDACIDINWSRTSWEDDPEGEALERTIKKLRRWLSRQDEELYAIWVRENPPKKGPGAHLMLHLPRRLLKPLKEIAMDLLPEGCRDTDGKAVWVHPAGTTSFARMSRVLYLSKGINPGRVCETLGIKPQDQGRVIGKRCGMTENLGPTAQRRHREVAVLINTANALANVEAASLKEAV